MTFQSDTASGAFADTPAARPAILSATKPLFWSIRRELWESKSLYFGPLIAAAVVIFGVSLGAPHFARAMHDIKGMDAAARAFLLVAPYGISGAALLMTSFIVAVFYCLGALHNERRDRSILFWKSLPVSDLTTVMSKALIPLVVLPAITFVVILLMQLVMLLISTAVVALNGVNPAVLWTEPPFLRMDGLLLYSLVVSSLWLAPVYAWILLVSSAAPRAPFLWLVLPPLAVMLIEKLAFGSNHFAAMLKYRIADGAVAAFSNVPHGRPTPTDYLPGIDPVNFLATPGLWAGIAFAALALGAAIWLRRYREPV
jgi:ABC-2 type transport system permease protein